MSEETVESEGVAILYILWFVVCIFFVDTCTLSVEEIRMKTRVQKWGNSLAVRIPKALAVEMHLEHNTEVNVSLEDDKIVVQPVVKPQFSLDQLLEEVTEENLHKETDTGPAVGQEAW